MSTRSGKRIHKSINETMSNVDVEIVPKSETRTRRKRSKENVLQFDVTIPKAKKKKNYVSYPAEEDPAGEITSVDDKKDTESDASAVENSRKLRRHTLKEHNANMTLSNILDSTNNNKSLRVTRQTKRFVDVDETTVVTKIDKVKGKKSKKKSKEVDATRSDDHNEVTVKKLKKKKKGNSKKTNEGSQNLNGSNMSVDSYHSAAGSPMKENGIGVEEDASKVNNGNEKENKESPFKIQKRSGNNTFDNAYGPREESGNRSHICDLNVTTEINTRKQKSSITNTTFDKNESMTINELDKDGTYDKIEELKEIVQNADVKETAIENGKDYEAATESPTAKLNDETIETKNLLHNIKAVEDLPNNISSKLDTTFEKDGNSKAAPLNSTFDKNESKLNTTFDKNEPKISSDRSSLISSDATGNLTFDKSNPCISITSDDSRSENILNSTPVLIESSIDETQLSTSKHSLNVPDVKVASKTLNTSAVPVTPLKREGTFTKESPDKIVAKENTPVKQLSLASPGCTPFHTTRSSQKRSILNVTRSIEKPGRRSSLAEIVPRQTKVMFCSPVNNPTAVMQNKNKVIKSSLKGSSKSFVFEESASSPRVGGRKRSLTHNDVEETRAKRSRLGDELQQSVDRLSRPRTLSAVGKLETKPVTPSKKDSVALKPKSDTKRTKLPNFAALHRKQFDRMESLDECQERKARRARQLLTPNATLNVLERNSPKAISESALKPTETPKERLSTPDTSKLKTLESLREGYTRFGFRFKMNTECNPFTVPSKNEKKEKEKSVKTKSLAPKTPVLPTEKPVQRQTTLPSLKGATRKEAAKQAVMREKSFTSLSGKRSVTRTESRTIIKGVRTNRRFELQMKMRNI